MFKFVSFITYDDDPKSYFYEIIDSDFECNALDGVATLKLSAQAAALEIFLEYKKRNYSHKDIVKNLFRFNLHLDKEYNFNFEDILNWQYKNINFSESYYQDIKDMWDKYKAFM